MLHELHGNARAAALSTDITTILASVTDLLDDPASWDVQCKALPKVYSYFVECVPASVAPVPPRWQQPQQQCSDVVPIDLLNDGGALDGQSYPPSFSQRATDPHDGGNSTPEDTPTQASSERQAFSQHVKSALESGDSHAIGLTFFNEAMRRLNLTPDLQQQKIRIRGLLESKNAQAVLETEKCRVKGELKRFDLQFIDQYGRPPSRADKEPLRPCYMYYRHLKWAIKKAETLGQSGGTKARSTSGSGDATITAVGGTAVVSTSRNGSDLEAQLEQLQREKSVVRATIQRFQEEFVKQHGRTIKYHKDVVKMENEYRQYKHLRARIIKLEDVLRRRKALQASIRNPSSDT